MDTSANSCTLSQIKSAFLHKTEFVTAERCNGICLAWMHNCAYLLYGTEAKHTGTVYTIIATSPTVTGFLC